MRIKRKKIKVPKEKYIEKEKTLSRKEAERLFSRMGGKLTRRLEDKKLSPLEVVALQLELEDEQLEEWRKNLGEIRNKRKD